MLAADARRPSTVRCRQCALRSIDRRWKTSDRSAKNAGERQLRRSDPLLTAANRDLMSVTTAADTTAPGRLEPRRSTTPDDRIAATFRWTEDSEMVVAARALGSVCAQPAAAMPLACRCRPRGPRSGLPRLRSPSRRPPRADRPKTAPEDRRPVDQRRRPGVPSRRLGRGQDRARGGVPGPSGPNKGPEFQWELDHALDIRSVADTGNGAVNALGKRSGATTVYDIDGINNPASTVKALHRLHDKAICYIEVGAAGNYYSAAQEHMPVTYYQQLKARGSGRGRKPAIPSITSTSTRHPRSGSSRR